MSCSTLKLFHNMPHFFFCLPLGNHFVKKVIELGSSFSNYIVLLLLASTVGLAIMTGLACRMMEANRPMPETIEKNVP